MPDFEINSTPILDLASGVIGSEGPSVVRKLSDLKEIFAQPDLADSDQDRVVYEIYGVASDVDGPARLLCATTVLHPGQVGGEYFMTRGHFHTDPSRGEFMVTLSGSGMLVLMDRSRQSWVENMSPGTVHDVDGRHAHRVVNTGDVPLAFLVVWMSDCGHDYDSIRRDGSAIRILAGPNGPEAS